MRRPNGTLTDVAGLAVGHWTDREAATGCTVVLCGSGAVVAALVAVNALGDVTDPSSGAVVAGPRSPGGGFVRTAAWLREHDPVVGMGGSTTLAVVATDAELTKPQAAKVAQMAHDGLARAIDPVHTMLYGDTVFALATGRAERAADVTAVGSAAATVLATAVLAAVRKATGLAGVPAISELGAGAEPA